MEKKISKQLNFLVGINLLFSLSGYFFSPILPLHIIDLGASKFQLGLIMTLSSISSTILRIPIGVIADRLGRRLIMTFGLLAQSLSAGLYSLITAVNWFFPVAVLRSSADSAFRPAAHATVSSLAPTYRERGKIMGKYLTTIGISMTVGPLISSILLRYFTFHQLFLFSAALPSIGLLAFMTRYSQIEKVSHDETHVVKPNLIRSFKRILLRRNTLLLCVISQLYNFSCYGVFPTFLSVYAKEFLFLSPATISLLFAVRGLASTVIRVPIGQISDKIGRKKPLIVGFSLFTFAGLLLSTQNIALAITGMIIFGVSTGIRAVIYYSTIGDLAPTEDSTLMMAFMMTMDGISSAVGSFVAGATATLISIPMLFQFSALTVFIAVPLIYFL